MTKKIGILILIIFATYSFALSQTVEDALRYAIPNGMVTPRAAGLNIAYHGLNDDYASIFYNPAGLAGIPTSELSFGFGFTRNTTNVDYLDTETEFSSNNAYVSNFGVVMPFEAGKNGAAIGIGYLLESDFTNNMDFKGFNRNSTLIGSSAQYGPRGFTDNLAAHLWLADDYFQTPIQDSLFQEVFLQESGGLHDVIGAVSFNLTESVSAGVSIIGKWGNFKYTREYSETDIHNKYNATDSLGVYSFEDPGTGQVHTMDNIHFNYVDVYEEISQKVSGISGAFGVQMRLGTFMRFNAAIRFPTVYQVDENYYRDAEATFDEKDGVIDRTTYDSDGENWYRLTTPWVYSGGFSVHAAGLIFTAGVEYVDITQMEFSDAIEDVEQINSNFIKEYVGQTTWGFGVEYDIPIAPVVARASYATTSSPYVRDVPGATIDYFSIGGGLFIAENVRLDGVFRWMDNSQLRRNYNAADNSSEYIYSINPLSIGFQLTYRFD